MVVTMLDLPKSGNSCPRHQTSPMTPNFFVWRGSVPKRLPAVPVIPSSPSLHGYDTISRRTSHSAFVGNRNPRLSATPRYFCAELPRSPSIMPTPHPPLPTCDPSLLSRMAWLPQGLTRNPERRRKVCLADDGATAITLHANHPHVAADDEESHNTGDTR